MPPIHDPFRSNRYSGPSNPFGYAHPQSSAFRTPFPRCPFRPRPTVPIRTVPPRCLTQPLRCIAVCSALRNKGSIAIRSVPARNGTAQLRSTCTTTTPIYMPILPTVYPFLPKSHRLSRTHLQFTTTVRGAIQSITSLNIT